MMILPKTVHVKSREGSVKDVHGCILKKFLLYLVSYEGRNIYNPVIIKIIAGTQKSKT